MFWEDNPDLWVTIFVATFLIIFFIAAIVSGPLRRRTQRRLAREIRGRMVDGYSTLHDFRKVHPREFPHIDTQYYDETQRWFEEQGFRHLGDLEDVTSLAIYPTLRTFIRSMVSGDGVVSVGIFDIRPQGWMRVGQFLGLVPKDFRTLDLETDFVNGTSFCTTNARNLAYDRPPELPRVVKPLGTSFEDMLAEHRQTIAEWREQDEGFEPVLLHTLDDVIESQNRAQAILNAHRKEVGYLTQEEMSRIMCPAGEEELAQNPSKDEFSLGIVDEIEKLNREEEPPSRRE